MMRTAQPMTTDIPGQALRGRQRVRYASYRDTAISWLGAVPSHWRDSRLADHAGLINGYPFDSSRFSLTEGVPLVRIRDILGCSTDVLWSGEPVEVAGIDTGDILVGMDGDFNVAWWRGGYAMLNQRVCCIRSRLTLSQRFLYYLLSFPLRIINDLTYATTVKHLSSFDVLRIRFALPPLPEQQAIAAFLDRETTKIDALVEKKRRLIELLKEKRAALISHAVTKGLNPEVPLKDSGSAWVGGIPKHWRIDKVKWVAKLESGHTPDKKVEAYWTDCDIPWVSLNDTKYLECHDYIGETANYVNALGIANSSARLLPPRAVVFSRDATIGRCAITERPMAVSQHFIAWLCKPLLSPEYLLQVFRSMTQDLERLTFGATVRTIGLPDVKTLVTPVPPLHEQEAIVAHIRRECLKLDKLAGKVQEAIARLLEYRTTLISAAVTGKIDVRGELAG